MRCDEMKLRKLHVWSFVGSCHSVFVNLVILHLVCSQATTKKVHVCVNAEQKAGKFQKFVYKVAQKRSAR